MAGNNKKKKGGNPIIEKDLMVFPPAIPFHPKAKKKADDDKEDETKTVTFKVAIGRGEDATKAERTEWSFRVFETASPWCRFLIIGTNPFVEG